MYGKKLQNQRTADKRRWNVRKVFQESPSVGGEKKGSQPSDRKFALYKMGTKCECDGVYFRMENHEENKNKEESIVNISLSMIISKGEEINIQLPNSPPLFLCFSF